MMKSVAAEDGTADLKKYGLDKPKLVTTLGAGSTRASLAIGGNADDASVYARDVSRPIVFTLEKAVLDDLTKKADDLRMKDLFAARSFTANGPEITHGTETRAFAKSKAASAEASAPGSLEADEAGRKGRERHGDERPAQHDHDAARRVVHRQGAPFGRRRHIVARSGDAAAPVEERLTLRSSGHVVTRSGPVTLVPPSCLLAEFDKQCRAAEDPQREQDTRVSPPRWSSHSRWRTSGRAPRPARSVADSDTIGRAVDRPLSPRTRRDLSPRPCSRAPCVAFALESLRTREVIYQRTARARRSASNMKIVTMAVAAERPGPSIRDDAARRRC